jgi:hypothetical protein
MVLRADLRQPDHILDDPAVRSMPDLTRPVGVLLVAVLHFLPDTDDPAGIIARLRARLAPGSYVAVSHASDDGGSPDGQPEAQRVYARSANQVLMRSRDQITAMLDGWYPVSPGVERIPLWRPDGENTAWPPGRRFPGFAAVAATTPVRPR